MAIVIIVLLIIIIIQLSIVLSRLPERDYVAEALERDKRARENKLL